MTKRLWYILFVFVLVASCNENEENPNSILSNKSLPDQESWSATFEVTVKGIPRAIIWSGYTAKYNKRQTIEFSDSIHVDFYDEFGLHQSELIADSGKVFDKTSDLEVWSNVTVISDSGIILESERLEWNNKKQKIFTDKPVTFYTLTDTLRGDYFESDPDLQNYEIGNPSGVSYRKSGNGR